MRTTAPLLAIIVALAPAAGLAAQAEGSGPDKSGRKINRQSKPANAGTRAYRRPMRGRDVDGYQEHLLEKVPFGSRRWWTIYEGEPLGR